MVEAKTTAFDGDTATAAYLGGTLAGHFSNLHVFGEAKGTWEQQANNLSYLLSSSRWVGGGANPLEVMQVTKNSFTLKSLPGHAEGAGNYITFRFEQGGKVLKVEAVGPAAPGWEEKLLPDLLWPAQQANMTDLRVQGR